MTDTDVSIFEGRKVVRPRLVDVSRYRVALRAPLAMVLGVDHWNGDEDERVALLGDAELTDLVDEAKAKSEAILADTYKYYRWEGERKTYRDVSEIITGHRDRKIRDEPYVAAEDLWTAYNLLTELWDFVNQATYLQEYKDQQVF